MSAPTPNPTHRESRRFSIRLPRPLWIVVATIVVIVVAVGLRIGASIYKQQEAILVVRSFGGTVMFDREGITWLDDFLNELDLPLCDDVAIDFCECNLTDPDLDRLKPYLETIPHLIHLHLDGDGITDEGLPYLVGLTRLETITILCPRVTEAGIVELNCALPHLCITASFETSPQKEARPLMN